MVHKMKVAAVQMRAELGNVKSNLSTAEALVREAFRKGAKWVILPEFFPSAVAFAPNMLTAWRPLEGEPFQLMQKLAREYEGVIGGSFIAKSGDDCLNVGKLLLHWWTGRRCAENADRSRWRCSLLGTHSLPNSTTSAK